jgi:hypothetical protein
LEASLDKRDTARLSAILLDLLKTSEFNPHTALGFFVVQTCADVFLDLVLDVKSKLILQFTLDSAPPEERTKANKEIAQHVLLGRFENLGNGGSQFLPGIGFRLKLLFSGVRQFVKFGSAVVVGYSPFGFNPPASFHPMECGIEGALLDTQRVTGNLLNALRDGPSMLWAESQRPEDEEIESALGKVEIWLRHGFNPFRFYKSLERSIVEVQGVVRWKLFAGSASAGELKKPAVVAFLSLLAARSQSA